MALDRKTAVAGLAMAVVVLYQSGVAPWGTPRGTIGNS